MRKGVGGGGRFMFLEGIFEGINSFYLLVYRIRVTVGFVCFKGVIN